MKYRRSLLLVFLGSLMWSIPSLNALTVPTSSPGRTSVAGSVPFAVYHPAFEVIPSVTHYAMGENPPSTLAGITQFFQEHTNHWEVAWDERGNRPHLIQGVGIPLLPGAGNHLTMTDLGLPAGQSIDIVLVEQLLRKFLEAHAALFRVAQGDLRRHPDSTTNSNGRLWLIDFEVFYHGIPIRGAKVFFRVNNGNIVQFGTELVGDVQLDVQPKVSGSEAEAKVLRHVGVEQSAAQVLHNSVLKIYPELTEGEVPGERYRGRPGFGYNYRLVWEVDFRLSDDLATYRGVVDAHTGSVLELLDRNKYVDALVSGGIYPNTNTDVEEVRPFVAIRIGNLLNGIVTRTFSNEHGIYNYGGEGAGARLSGPFVSTNDTCGLSGLGNNTDGNLNFGTSSGTDCTTPGIGGAGNTHASRNVFYHLMSIKQTVVEFLPNNAWLFDNLVANTNIVDTCNAFWNGETVNFFRSGDGCSNTGEIAAVALHEFGHGLDDNTGGAANENGSGEALGDITAFLETRDSCIGPNFQPGVVCHNCESTGCTGVRDMTPFASGGAATIARPNTVENNAGMNCDRFQCPFFQVPPFFFPYQGPMGYEGHCESYIASSAVWDLTQLLIAEYGTDPGWKTMKQIWYDSLFPTKSAYQVVSGGKCNPAATVNGCGASNWYTVFLAIDDDDGNLANGTPNACRIWQAFNDHGIACGVQPPCS